MWANCMRFVGEKGVRASELETLARTKTNLDGMRRWGYIVAAPDPADSRPKPPRTAWLIRATSKGRQAQEVWQPLFSVIEKRWQARFGKDEIARLRESLSALNSQFDPALPDCLPILGYGLFSRRPPRKSRAQAVGQKFNGSALSLPSLLSRVLLALAIEFEDESNLSLAICANVVRVLDEKGVRLRDLPHLTGVSKEAIAMALGILRKRGFAAIAADQTAGRAKVVGLTAAGREVQEAYGWLVGVIEERWQTRFGKDAVPTLRSLLIRLVGEPTAQASPLFRGLEPYPDGWRASVPKPGTLPHYPMVLHRGGFPDGS
jgi:DNA-binding MarR family transcriptional regulator